MDTGSESPVAPPYSPLTPELPSATYASVQETQAQPELTATTTTATFPTLTPISESTNPDAIALRSALSLLQIQRLRAIGDLQTLDEQKKSALAKPRDFAQALADGKITSRSTVSPWNVKALDAASDDEGDEDGRDISSAMSELPSDDGAGKQMIIPGPQNVIRCPPINWDRYHIVGEPLDKLHEDHRRRPPSGEGSSTSTRPAHTVAAPYSPWRDAISEAPMRPKPNLSEEP